MKEITNKNFKDTILEGEGVKAIKLHADWCGPCKQFAPIMERFASTVNDIEFYTLDVEQSPELVEELCVKSIPTVIFFQNGVEAYRFNGTRNEMSLEEEILPKVRAATV